jgi:hypothetical protein
MYISSQNHQQLLKQLPIKHPRAKIYEQILSDLGFCSGKSYQLLPLSMVVQQNQRLKPCLAKVQLTLGNNQAASTLAQKVISGYSFRLVTGYNTSLVYDKS